MGVWSIEVTLKAKPYFSGTAKPRKAISKLTEIFLMKKLTAILLLLTVTSSAIAQMATIRLKAGEEKRVVIKAHSSEALFTDQGNIKYSELASVDFDKENTGDKNLYEKLAAAGVQVSFGNRVKAIEIQSPLIVNQQQQPITIDIDKFREQRNLGKALQFVGVATLAASIVLANRYAKKADDPDAKAPPEALPMIGLGVMGLGIVIDIDASRHLKKQ